MSDGNAWPIPEEPRASMPPGDAVSLEAGAMSVVNP